MHLTINATKTPRDRHVPKRIGGLVTQHTIICLVIGGNQGHVLVHNRLSRHTCSILEKSV